MGELENMPNSYSHTIYKQYVDMLKDKEAKEANEASQVMDEIEDNLM